MSGDHSAARTDAPSVEEFRAVYRQTVDEVYGFWTPAMQEAISQHNAGWGPSHDFKTYLVASETRYVRVYQALLARFGDPMSASICDVGGFWGVWPVTLARLGLQATLTEALAYYGGAFDRLFAFAEANGVEVLDWDPFEQEALARQFDWVTLMAVLEHYPHSLRRFLSNVRNLLASRGFVYVEVPNFAYLLWRMNMLRGKSPLVPATDIYQSQVPFTGHHHEFTIAELLVLLRTARFEILKWDAYNYSVDVRRSLHAALEHPRTALRDSILVAVTTMRPRTREVLSVLGRRDDSV